ncbi:uncharacterized protein RCH25_036302 [Pelodytes ibericus]
MEHSVPKAAVPPHDTGKSDTPRTRNLKFIREQRLNYFCGKKSKSTVSAIPETPRSGTNISTSFHLPKKSKTPRKCLSAPPSHAEKPISISTDVQKHTSYAEIANNITELTRQENSPPEAPTSEPCTHRSLLSCGFIADLNQELLEDRSVPETQKLQHVMTWAQTFLNKWNIDGSVQNNLQLSQEDAFKRVDNSLNSSDENASKTHAFKITNPTEKKMSFKSGCSSDAVLFSASYSEDTRNHKANLSSPSTSIDSEVSLDSDFGPAKKQSNFYAYDEELLVSNTSLPGTPSNIYRTNQIPKCTPGSDPFSSQWTDFKNKKRGTSGSDLVTAHDSLHKKGFTKSLCEMLPTKRKSGSSKDTSITQSNIYLVKQLADSRVEDWSEEEERVGGATKYKQYDYDSDNTITESEGDLRRNYHEGEGDQSSESSLNTERLDALLTDFEMLHKRAEKRNQSTEDDGSRTDRTFLVTKYVESETSRQYKATHGLDCYKTLTNVPHGNQSAKNVSEDPKANLYKVCPDCGFTRNTNTRWCAECGSVLFAAQSHIHRQSTVIDPPTTHGKFLDSNSSEVESPHNSLERSLSPKQKDKECKRTACWEDDSDATSDCDGSVLEKYLFYVNKLNMLKGEQNKNPVDYLSTSRSREVSSEDESSVEYSNPYLQTNLIQRNVILIEDKSDSEEGETQFLGATTTLLKPAAQETPKDPICFEDNLKVFNGKKNESSLDRKLQKAIEMPSKVTGPRRYWEKSSIAWSSYTHGELKPRSADHQRPGSAGAAKKIPNNQCRSNTNSEFTTSNKMINQSKKPYGTPVADASEYKNTAVAYMKTANAWAISENLSKRNWDCFSDTPKWDSEGDRGSMWLFLPDELWICIFSNLPQKDLSNAAQVCHRFHHIANDDSLWKVIEITNSHSLNDDTLMNIGLHHPESLILHRCHNDNQCISEDGLGKLFQNCMDSLMDLKITNCSGPGFVGDIILFHASKYCSHLTSVDISWTAATDKGVTALLESSVCLKSLSVNGCKITDHAVTALVKKHWKSLVKLEVFGCHALTAKCLCFVATDCTHLQILNIGRVPNITDLCLAKIASNLHKITTLNVTGLNVVRDRAVHHIVMRCSKLENLTLSSCCQVTDVSLVEISTYLQTIKYLDVSGCKKVTDIGIQALARSCRQISYLDLSSTGTGKRGVCLLASYCYSSLECLKLSFCKEVTADAIEKLCKNCKRLKVLHLYGCRMSQDLNNIKKFRETFKIFHDLSIQTANILGE